MKPISLPDSLRWHAEPLSNLSDADVHHALMGDPGAYIGFLRERLHGIAEGAIAVDQPPKQIFDDPGGGDFRVMPSVTKGATGVFKTVKVVGTNVSGQIVPDQVTVGKAMVLHPVENYVTHMADGCLLSSARTGACAALGAERIGAELGRIVLIGAGRVAYYAARCLAPLWPDAAFSVFDPLSQRADRLARDLSEHGLDAKPVSEPRSEPGALLVLATTSAVPLLERDAARKSWVVSVGADTPWQRELGESWADEPAILTDTRDSLRVGDLLAWQEAGRRIPKLVLMTEPTSGHDGRVFISTGCALFDNLTLDYLVNRHAAAPSDAYAETGSRAG